MTGQTKSPRRVAYVYRFPILNPHETRDHFNYSIERHYGSSNHSVFRGAGRFGSRCRASTANNLREAFNLIRQGYAREAESISIAEDARERPGNAVQD